MGGGGRGGMGDGPGMLGRGREEGGDKVTG
jgi:hypothetical protein